MEVSRGVGIASATLTCSDNNEFYLHDDEFLCRNQMPVEMASPADGPTTIGLMGRMMNVSNLTGYELR